MKTNVTHTVRLSCGGALNPLIHQPLNHLLQHSASTGAASLKVRSNTLLNILANHVHFDIDILALPLVAHNDLLLCVRDEHNLPPTLVIVDSGDGQRSSIKRHISLLHDVPQHKLVPGLQAESDRIAILPRLGDLSNRVDMTLHKVASHACVRSHGALEVDVAALFQTAQVRASQSLRRNTDFELVFAELSHGKTGTVDADAVAEVGIAKDIGAARDGQTGAAAAAGGFVMLDETRNGWPRVSAQRRDVRGQGRLEKDILPMVSTMPVNMMAGIFVQKSVCCIDGSSSISRL